MRCEFDLATGLGYTLPEPAVPTGYTADSYLRRLCSEAALRRYGTVTAGGGGSGWMKSSI